MYTIVKLVGVFLVCLVPVLFSGVIKARCNLQIFFLSVPHKLFFYIYNVVTHKNAASVRARVG